jgi:GNAT superfamily N-acetyltransferase
VEGVVRVRCATAEDTQTLVELMADFYSEAEYVLNREHATRAFEALFADPQRGRTWIIAADSEDVGYVVLTFVYSMEYGGLTALVEDLYVRPESRNAGLGTAALAEVRLFCVGLGVRAMSVQVGRENGIAQSVYRRTGFATVDRRLMTLELASPTHVV